MRFDIENIVAQAMADYLKARLDASIQATCPVTTLLDTLAIEDADRVICECTGGETDAADGFQWTVNLDVAVKTMWGQATRDDSAGLDPKSVEQDYALHNSRVSAVGGLLIPTLFDDTEDTSLKTTELLAARINAMAPDGIEISFVSQSQSFRSRIVDGWFLKVWTLSISGNNTTP